MAYAIVALIFCALLFPVAIYLIVKPITLMMAAKKQEAELSLLWATLNNHLAKQDFNISSQMEVVRIDKPDKRILNLHIAIDMENKKFLFTKAVKNETFELVSESLAFDTISGGEILVGGKSSSSSSFGTGVGQGTGFGSMVATGSGFSSSTTYVHSVEYKIKTTDMLHPIYNVAISYLPEEESSDTYKHYMDIAIRLDTIIQQIVANNKNNS